LRVNKTANIEKGERKRRKGVGWKYEIIIKMQNMAFISIEPENFNGKKRRHDTQPNDIWPTDTQDC
jgi:hypothetical protein